MMNACWRSCRGCRGVVVVALVWISWLALGSTAAAKQEIVMPSWVTDAVFRFEANGQFVDRIVPSGSGTLDGPHGMCIGADGDFYVSSFFNDKVLKFDGETGAPLGDFVSSGSGGLSGPMGCQFGSDGNLYVAGFNDGSVLRYNGATGAFIDAFVAPGSVPQMFTEFMTFGPDGHLYVATGSVRHSVIRFDSTSGLPIDEFVAPTSGGLLDPHTFAFGPGGDLYVASFGTHEVKRYSGTSGVFIEDFVTAGSGGLVQPHGITFGDDGLLYVTSWATHQVLRYDATDGDFVDVFIDHQIGGLLNPQIVIFRDVRDRLVVSVDADGPSPALTSGAHLGTIGVIPANPGTPIISSEQVPWSVMHSGVPGSDGVPELRGSGPLQAGADVELTLSAARPGAAAVLFMSPGASGVMFKGGLLVPDVEVGVALSVTTGADGGLHLAGTWPDGVPAGLSTYHQLWIADPAGPVGYAASNALLAVTR